MSVVNAPRRVGSLGVQGWGTPLVCCMVVGKQTALDHTGGPTTRQLWFGCPNLLFLESVLQPPEVGVNYAGNKGQKSGCLQMGIHLGAGPHIPEIAAGTPWVCRPELLREDATGPIAQSAAPPTRSPGHCLLMERGLVPGRQAKPEKQFWCGAVWGRSVGTCPASERPGYVRG